MPPGQPGGSSRGRGGKFKKYTRGGGKQFSRDLQPVDSEGNAVSMWSQQARQRSSNKEESSEEEEEEDDEDDEAGPSSTVDAEATREARKAQKKARKEAAIAKSKARNVEVGDLPSSEEEDSDEDEDDDDAGMPANPNYSAAARKQTAPVSATVDDITEGMRKMPGNRREREAAEAAAAKERYMKLSAQGKTDTAKADLARLKLIREQRETEAARRQAEKEEREEQEAKKKAEIEAREAKRREAAMGPQKGKKK